MTDYEYLFSTNLHAKLKERIQGGIFVKVNENDSLVIKITRRDENNFDMSFTDFSNIAFMEPSCSSLMAAFF